MINRTKLLANKMFAELNPVIFGEADYDKPNSFGPFSRDYYLVHYIVRGRGKYITPNGTFNLSEGKIFLIKPGEITTYFSNENTPFHYIWIGFTGKCAEKFHSLDYVMNFDGSIFKEMVDVFDVENMAEEFLLSKLFMFYYEIFSEKKQLNFEKKVKSYIDSNYMNKIEISELSLILGLNRSYLSRIFKKRYSITISDYIVKVKMEHALKFLKNGMNVGQSALLVGYADQFTFSKMFKKYYGFSPKEVRT